MRIAIAVIAVAVIIVAFVLFRGCGQENALQAPPGGDVVTENVPADTSLVTPPGPDGRLVDVGGHRLLVRTFGTGSPAVVIEPGIGDAGRIWQRVIERLEGKTEVVLYARAGYEGSDPGPMPRSTEREVQDLTQLLVDTPIEPPYIVVGHSLGANNALLYASEHPNLVAGLVLLDPPPLGFMQGKRFPRMRAMADSMTAGFRKDAAEARAAGDIARANQMDAIASEHEQLYTTTAGWVASVTDLGDIPLVVLASGVPNPGFREDAEPFQEYWRESSEKVSRLSSRGRFVYLEHSTHDIPNDATEAVVDAVMWCIAQPRVNPDRDMWEGDK